MATQLKKTVMPSGGDYTSLEACMNANEQNLVTADQYFDVEIDGTWSSVDTSVVTIHNYIIDTTRYINVYTTSAAGHKGIYSTSYYVLAPTDAVAYGLYLSTGGGSGAATEKLSITGIQINLTGATSGNRYGIHAGTNRDHYISKCIILNCVGSAYWHDNENSISHIWNCIIYSCGTGLRKYYGLKDYWYSNTIFNCTTGINSEADAGRSADIINNIVQGGTTCYTGTFGTTTDNISSDTSSPNNEWDSVNVAFVNEGAGVENLHLDVSDTSGAKDGGTDLSATFTDDIDGVTRSGTWDIGADEYVTSGVATGFMTANRGYW